MSKQRAKGTAAESAVVSYLREHGFRYAERRALRGNADAGDIAGVPGFTIDVKAHAEMRLAEWLDRAEEQASNGAVGAGVVWHKRRGKGSPGDWYVTMSGDAFVWILEELK